MQTIRLELRPLPAVAAAALPEGRAAAARELRLELSPSWPQPDLLDVLPIQAAAPPDQIAWGIWVIIENRTQLAVGDIGFFGPVRSVGPAAGARRASLPPAVACRRRRRQDRAVLTGRS